MEQESEEALEAFRVAHALKVLRDIDWRYLRKKIQMTYIVGWKFGDNAVIYSDTNVSGSINHQFALKTGVLFPGVIVGMAGSVRDGGDFLNSVKQAVAPSASIQDNWRLVTEIAETYSFPQHPGKEFTLLFSTRATGSPEFWIVDSNDGLQKIRNRIVTVGSGRPILDKFVEGYLSSLRKSVSKPGAPAPNKIPAPFMLCLALFAKTQGLDKIELEQLDVGGIFHFVYQTSETEGGQPSALYVLLDQDDTKRLTIAWTTRVLYLDDGLLLVESGTPPGQTSMRDPGRIERNVLSNAFIKSHAGNVDEAKWKQSLLDKSANLPFYVYCGFTALDQTKRHRTAHTFRNADKSPYVIDRNGRFHKEAIPDVIKYIFNGDSSNSEKA